jgi:hypothetical protein
MIYFVKTCNLQMFYFTFEIFFSSLHNYIQMNFFKICYDEIDFQTLGLHFYEINRGNMQHLVL